MVLMPGPAEHHDAIINISDRISSDEPFNTDWSDNGTAVFVGSIMAIWLFDLCR